MCVQTKRELLEYLRDETKTFDAARMERFSANAIGKKKNISRTLVSQYLNELFMFRKQPKQGNSKESSIYAGSAPW